MTQDQKRANPSQQDLKQAKDSAKKSVDTAQNELDPRPELGLKSPVEESEDSSERPDRREADDTPMAFGKSKESRNDQ